MPVKQLRALALALGVLLLVVCPTVAFGDTADPGVPPAESSHPSNESSLTDPQAAADLPHSDLDRPEAVELLEEVFEPVLQSPAGPFDDLSVEELIGNHAAIVPSDQRPEPAGIEVGGEEGQESVGDSILLESTLPLRVEGEVLDLSLEDGGSSLEPVNPLVNVQIPDELGKGIGIPEASAQIELVDAPEDRAPSLVDSTAVYPNVATDTDLVVAPAPTGVETLTAFRSPQAPNTQSFRLKLPEEDELRAAEGGIEVTSDDGETSLFIHEPTAIDAEGVSVPVEMAGSNDEITLTIHPEQGSQYPILADPMFETFTWAGTTNNVPYGWEASTSNADWPYMGANFSEPTAEHPARGLLAFAAPHNFSSGDDVHWSHAVPRYAEGVATGKIPTSFIAGFTMSSLYTKGSAGPSSPFVYGGIRDPALNAWAGLSPYQAYWRRDGNLPNIVGGTVSFTPGGDEQAKIAVGPGMQTSEPAGVSSERNIVVGAATIEVGDTEPPEAQKGSVNEVWANQTGTGPIEATIADRGLGAKRATFGGSGIPSVQVSNSCAGTVASSCPSEWRASLPASQYFPVAMPQGWLSIPVWGEDVLGNKSATPALAELGIDHTKPALSAVSGSITEQQSVGTRRLEYGLKYSATDGFESPSTLGKATSTPTPYGLAVDAAGSVWVVDGDHNLVRKFNQAGELILTIGSTGSGNGQFIEPRSVAIDKDGNAWITDKGNHRLEEFSSAGKFLREAKVSGLVEPYGIAISPDGSFWVSDQASNSVMQLTGPEYGLMWVRTVTGEKTSTTNTTFSAPRGLATDAKGDVWVADSNNNRLQEINPKGVIIGQVGTTGSKATQLRTPYAVAVTGLGHLLVADAANNRLQLFDPEGYFLRFIGANQMEKPRGVAMGSGNTAYAGSGLNSQLQQWNNVDLDAQSGVVKGEVLVDGIPREVFKPSCSGTANCLIASHEWVLNAREYAEGKHSVQVAVTDGVGLTSTSPELTVDLHPDRTAPEISWSGSLTEQGTLGTTRPTYTLKVQGVDPEPKEGSLIFGGSVTGNGTPFVHPGDVAVDGKGNYWVADTGQNRLLKFSASGTYLSVVGGLGSGSGKLNAPSALAADTSGNVWVADTANNRIEEFSESGSFVLAFGKDVNQTKVEAAASEAERNLCTAASGNVCKAGVEGSALGQFKAPKGVAVTSSGNVWVADTGNNRLQKLSSTGAYLNKLSLVGQEGSQLKEPMGVAVGGDGSIWAADTGNNRVVQWNSSLAFVRQFGSLGSGSREFNSPRSLDIDAKGNVWVADQGNGRVKKFDSTGQFLIGYGTQQPTGDSNSFGPAGIALDGQGGLYVADWNNNRVQHWNATNTSQSGVVSSTIKVDGKVVDSYNQSCSTENCALTREWTLKSDSFGTGLHMVEATVTDGSGLSSVKKLLSITINRDTTAPQVASTGPLAEAPEGWVEQKTYSVTATATDANGYGVKQIRLLVDGSLVGESAVTSCEAGGCSKAKTFNINAANYKGGAHQVEVLAEDGAGNWKKQSWTMNVDPQGAINAGEAAATLEAMEETVPPEEEFEPVASTADFLEKQEIEAGDNPHFKFEEGKIVSSGVTVDVEFDPGTEILSMEGTDGPLELSPTVETSQPEIIEGAAAILPSTNLGSDTTLRPEYNGAYMFTTIRDSSAPEEYAWHVHLFNGQYLTQSDSTHIQVMSKTGAEAWTIVANSARDATGKEVPTQLSIIDQSDFALTVKHRSGGFVYPVSAGQSYITGYAIVTAYLPEEQSEEGEASGEPDPFTGSEEAAEGFKFNDPLSQVEQEDATEFSKPNHPDHRDPNKVVRKREARHLAHPQPLYSGSLLLRPVPPKEVPGEIYKLNVGTCSSFNCDIWQLAINEGTFKVTDKLAEWWSPAGCNYEIMGWWSWNLAVDVVEMNHRNNEVKRGSGEHITYWCKYNVSIWPLPEELCMQSHFSLQEWVFPNGYTQRHLYTRSSPYYPQLPPIC